MTSLPITSLFAALFGIVFVPLSLQVGLKRLQTGIFFGNGGDLALMQRQAAQGNFVQYVPFALLLMALCEISGIQPWMLVTAGASLVIGRSLHAFSMFTTGTGNTRAAGMIFTFATFLTVSGWLLYAHI